MTEGILTLALILGLWLSTKMPPVPDEMIIRDITLRMTVHTKHFTEAMQQSGRAVDDLATAVASFQDALRGDVDHILALIDTAKNWEFTDD